MTNEMIALRAQADEARIRYGIGEITREKAQELIQPYLDAANEKGKEIAKKHKRKYSPISFIGFIR